jgi:hemerythrin-like domain-containing protein
LRHDIDLTNAVLSAQPVRPSDQSVMMSWIRQAHEEQLALCRELEEIADSLPASVNRQKCIYAAKALCPLIRSIHHYEENVLFPYLAQQQGHSGPMLATLSRLKFEHFEDEGYAEELTDALLRLGSGEPVNVEAVGYMLRGFFEGVRRHIAFEQAHLLQNYLPFSPISE